MNFEGTQTSNPQHRSTISPTNRNQSTYRMQMYFQRIKSSYFKWHPCLHHSFMCSKMNAIIFISSIYLKDTRRVNFKFLGGYNPLCCCLFEDRALIKYICFNIYFIFFLEIYTWSASIPLFLWKQQSVKFGVLIHLLQINFTYNVYLL